MRLTIRTVAFGQAEPTSNAFRLETSEGGPLWYLRRVAAGGSWAYGPPDFDEFEEATVGLLRRGLRGAILRRVLHPTTAARNLATAGWAIASRALGPARPQVVRPTNRTDGLASALADLAFGAKTMSEVTHKDLDIVLTATDLRTGNAVRFGSACSSCSRFGTIVEPVEVATAVAASAAFPLLLPAIERTFTFDSNGQGRTRPSC